MVRQCLAWGATSTDSSSFVKYAARGRCFNPALSAPDGHSLAPLARMQLALRNLAHLQDPTCDRLPLSAIVPAGSKVSLEVA